jgi:hypothetical protein
MGGVWEGGGPSYLDLSLRADLSYLGLSRAGGRGTGRRRRQGILISIARFTTVYRGLARFGAGGPPNGQIGHDLKRA